MCLKIFQAKQSIPLYFPWWSFYVNAHHYPKNSSKMHLFLVKISNHQNTQWVGIGHSHCIRTHVEFLSTYFRTSQTSSAQLFLPVGRNLYMLDEYFSWNPFHKSAVLFSSKGCVYGCVCWRWYISLVPYSAVSARGKHILPTLSLEFAGQA